jgi:hypothetical protein
MDKVELMAPDYRGTPGGVSPADVRWLELLLPEGVARMSRVNVPVVGLPRV